MTYKGVINQIGCKIKKERQKDAWKVGRGATVCHNILLPSKVMKEWRNIPLNLNFSAIENFEYQTWRDFSDLRLIEPSRGHPIIEVEIALNFFPGDHFTAER